MKGKYIAYIIKLVCFFLFALTETIEKCAITLEWVPERSSKISDDRHVGVVACSIERDAGTDDVLTPSVNFLLAGQLTRGFRCLQASRCVAAERGLRRAENR